VSGTLQRLLDEGAAFDCEFRGGLSNHRPMALTALAALGAGDARLEAFAAAYSRRLKKAPRPVAWKSGEPWRGRFGQRAAWPRYRDLFDEWIAHEGSGAVLAQALPFLVEGCGAAAFHGLIRTAYAVRAGHRGELVDGLAYWSCRWLDLGAARPAGRVADPLKLLKELAMAPADARGGHALIFERMQAAAAGASDAAAAAGTPFAAAVTRLRVDEATLERIARAAARLYAASGNFTVLHLVTGAQALRVVTACLEDRQAALAAVGAFWRAAVAGALASGARFESRLPDARPWDELVAAALASDDEHLIKLVDACREEQRVHGGEPDWQRAATRAVLQARTS
jgi:hypothetical protein